MADDKDKQTPNDPENVEGQAPEVKAAGDPPEAASQSPEAPEAPEADTPTAEAPEADTPAAEAPEADAPTAEAPEADASEADAPEADTPTPEAKAPDAEASAAEAPEADAAEPEAPTAEAPETQAPAAGVASEPTERIPPKERRRRARSKHVGDARPARTPEERHADRLLERRKKAVARRARRLQERAKATGLRAAAPAPEPLAPVHAPVEGARRVRQGIVVSDKAEKTITVRIDVARRHRRYEKIVRSSSTLHAHDENNDAHEGDVVRVIESRPLSRTKRWKLVDVLERAR
jgi:small subunit ribosomal protein S17